MKLQVALDFVTIPEAKEIIGKIGDAADVFEIGTLVVMQHGLDGISELHRAFPDATLLADTKIMDGGGLAAQMIADAGASICTVLAASDDATVRSTIEVAHKNGLQVLVDLISVEDVEKRALEVDAMKPDYICIHTGVDTQQSGASPLENLRKVSKVVKNAKIAVAGGISPDSMEAIAAENPALVIAGSYITAKGDMLVNIKNLKSMMK